MMIMVTMTMMMMMTMVKVVVMMINGSWFNQEMVTQWRYIKKIAKHLSKQVPQTALL